MKLDGLLELPQSGVVILTKQGQVLISYTTSMGAHLESLYQQFKGQRGITLEVRSANADLETLRLHTEYYRDLYGPTLLQAHLRKSIKYRVRSVPSADLKRVDVEVVTARGDSRVVGKFKTVREAQSFIETYYGTDNPFKLPVLALNSDTKEFVLSKQTKLLDIK